MPAHHDATEFVDTEFEEHKTLAGSVSATAAGGAAPGAGRAPSPAEVNGRILDAQKKLAELKRAQDELERERVALEETRRRQDESTRGREEMISHLTRGTGLLEEAEFAARRDAELMAKTLVEFREALEKLQAIHPEHWKQNQFNVELTRALTVIENARMEWNSARLKFPVLAGTEGNAAPSGTAALKSTLPLAGLSLGELCRLGLALTWPLAAVAALALALMLMLLWRGH